MNRSSPAHIAQDLVSNSSGTGDRERKRIAYVASESLAKISSLLPSNRGRSLLVHSLVTSLGLHQSNASSANHNSINILRPPLATAKDVLAYYDRDYVDYVLGKDIGHDEERAAEFGLEDDCPPFAGIAQYVQGIAGATLAATRALAEDLCDISICWDGGRHHAHKERASGFCYVNDCVLALLALKRAPHRPRVLYLDLDLHFSDGVSSAFHSPSRTLPSQLLTLSIHHAAPGFFPAGQLAQLPKVSEHAEEEANFDPFTLSVPLNGGGSNATFAAIWPAIERVKDAFGPDVVVVQCGVDGLAGDPCAIWNWGLGGEGGLGWCIDRIVHRWGAKVLLLGGGGYSSPNAARAWAYLTSITRGDTLSLDTPIPDHKAFPLYAPSFTLDVPAGNARDHNTPQDIADIERALRRAADMIRDRLPHGA
ncbi:histone deacetylase complex protein [Amylostereum chailletii]|nr:histone deacetylase complex protein [Amylostereum chailletii]